MDRIFHETLCYPPPRHKEVMGLFHSWALADHRQPLIVSHPFLNFDPASAATRLVEVLEHEHSLSSSRFVPNEVTRRLVLHEKFDIHTPLFEGLPSFTETLDRELGFREGESVWDDTGFWGAHDEVRGFLGAGENSARQLLHGVPTCRLVFVLAAPAMVLTFAASGSTANEYFEMDAYLNNRYLAFSDARSAISRALFSCGNHSSRGFVRDEQRKIMGGEELPFPEDAFDFFPEAVLPIGSEIYQAVVGPLDARLEPWAEAFGRNRYFITRHGGYWFREDLLKGSRFRLWSFAPYFLRTCVLVDPMVAEDDYLSYEGIADLELM